MPMVAGRHERVAGRPDRRGHRPIERLQDPPIGRLPVPLLRLTPEPDRLPGLDLQRDRLGLRAPAVVGRPRPAVDLDGPIEVPATTPQAPTHGDGLAGAYN